MGLYFWAWVDMGESTVLCLNSWTAWKYTVGTKLRHELLQNCSKCTEMRRKWAVPLLLDLLFNQNIVFQYCLEVFWKLSCLYKHMSHAPAWVGAFTTVPTLDYSVCAQYPTVGISTSFPQCHEFLQSDRRSESSLKGQNFYYILLFVVLQAGYWILFYSDSSK